MLYAGFFEYEYNNENKEPRRGSFVYFVDAPDPDAAVDAFKNGIKKTARMPGVGLHGDIFLKSFVGLKKLPAEGALAFLQDERDNSELRVTIGCTLPGKPSGLDGFEWCEDGKEPLDDETEYEISKFLIIPAPKKSKWVKKKL